MTDTTDFITDRQMAILGATRDIVCAALHPDSGAIVPDVIDLLEKVHGKVTALVSGPAPEPVAPTEKVTAAQARKSITPDGIVSFIDGKVYKTLRRHLTKHGLTPEGYRERYGLPADYPIVSAAYSAQRADLARAIGLGQMRQKSPEPASAPNPTPKTRRGKALEPA